VLFSQVPMCQGDTDRTPGSQAIPRAARRCRPKDRRCASRRHGLPAHRATGRCAVRRLAFSAAGRGRSDRPPARRACLRHRPRRPATSAHERVIGAGEPPSSMSCRPALPRVDIPDKFTANHFRRDVRVPACCMREWCGHRPQRDLRRHSPASLSARRQWRASCAWCAGQLRGGGRDDSSRPSRPRALWSSTGPRPVANAQADSPRRCRTRPMSMRPTRSEHRRCRCCVRSHRTRLTATLHLALPDARRDGRLRRRGERERRPCHGVVGHTGALPLRNALAVLLGLPEASIRVIYVEASGCYGHNGADDVAAEAALISKLAGAPIRLQWTRQEEHGWEPLGPAWSIRCAAPCWAAAAWPGK